MKNVVISFSSLAFLALFLNIQFSSCSAQGTAFSYQGLLQSSGQPAGGIYDLRFSIYDSQTNGNLLGGPITNSAVPVTNGLFTATVDFGNIFNGGSNWLDIAVSTNGANAFVELTPRQQLLPVPYAITAANLSGAVSAAQLPYIPLTNNESAVTLSGNFSGNGGGLTSLNASQLSSGTVSMAQLPYILITNNESPVTLAGTFSGNGSGLTSLNATNVSGTLSPVNLPYIVVTNNESAVTLSGNFSGNGSGLFGIPFSALPAYVLTNNENNVTLYGSFSGSGSGLFGIPYSALPIYVLTNNENNVTLYGSFSGSGSGLFGIPYSALPTYVLTNNENNVTLYGNFSGNGSGLFGIPYSALPTYVLTNNENNVTLYGNFSGNGSGLFGIPYSALPTYVLTNNENNVTLSGTFSGNGGGLFGIPITALSASVITNTETGVTLSGTFSGNGSGFTNLETTGTYTPTNAAGGTSGGTGYYTKMGNLVFVQASCFWTGSGNTAEISLPPGLPPVSQSATFAIGSFSQITFTGQLTATLSGSYVLLFGNTSGSSSSALAIAPSGNIVFSGFYRWQ
ncbi:MAG TPA: hypothetical protein VGN23_02390 [Verrucomicrobiae bacterium]